MTSEVTNRTLIPVYNGPSLSAMLFSLRQGTGPDEYPVEFQTDFNGIRRVRLIIIGAENMIREYFSQNWHLKGILPSYRKSPFHLSADAEPLWPGVKFCFKNRAGEMDFDPELLVNLMPRVKSNSGIID